MRAPAAVTYAHAPALTGASRVDADGLSVWLADDARSAGHVALRLSRRGPCAPLRAAGRLDGAAARRWLAREAPDLRRALEALGDRAEFVIALEDRRPAEERDASGGGYLRALAEARRAASAWEARVADTLAQAARAVDARLCSAPRQWRRLGAGACEASLLAPRGAASAAAELCDVLAERLGDAVAVRGSGPWPAYSFMDDLSKMRERA